MNSFSLSSTSMLLVFLVVLIGWPLTESQESSLPTTLSIRNRLNGVHLKLAVFTVVPFNVLTLTPDGNYTHSGSSHNIIEWLSERLHFTFSYLMIDDSAIAKYGPGTSQAINLIVDKEVDGSGVGMIITPERKEKMDFAYLIWTEPYTIVSPRPGEEPRVFSFVWPFQANVWLLILISMVVVVSLMTLFSWIYNEPRQNPSDHHQRGGKITNGRKTIYDNAGRYAIFVTNTMTNQGGTDPIRQWSFRLLVGGWLLAALVLVNSYSGTVISFLTVPRMKAKINTFEDLAASRDVGMILYRDIIITQQIKDAKSGVLKALGDLTRNDGQTILPSMAKVAEQLDTGRYALPYLSTYNKFYVVNKYKKEGGCRFLISDALPISGFWPLPMQKDSKYTSTINAALIEVWQYGLPPLWVKNAVPPAPKCFAKLKAQAKLTRLEPIHLDDVIGLFLILGVGIVSSILIFLLEMMTMKCQ